MNGLEGTLWLLVAVSLVGDVSTTFVGLHIGFAEGNPVARSVIDSWGLVGMLGLKLVAVAVALAMRPAMPPEFRALIPAALALTWFGAVAINLYMLSSVV
ncbi:MAG: DUF5658 family protein [Natrialbaceae archaeon]|nr:DUF5658 family protein [Natrialbaceae archaeon]